MHFDFKTGLYIFSSWGIFFFNNNFVTPKNWNQVRCFSTGEVLNVYILYIIIQNHNMEYYSEMKGNGLLIHTTTYISRELR